MAAHSRGPDDGAGLDPVDKLTGPGIFANWLRSQADDDDDADDAPDLLFEIEKSRLIRIAAQRHEQLWTTIEREHRESIAALVHVGLIDEPTFTPKRRTRRTTKDKQQ